MTDDAAPTAPPVRTASEEELSQVAETLAAAFVDDPVFCWCDPEAGRRRAILPSLFEVLVAEHLSHGGVLTTDGALAAAVWVPPGVEEDESLMAELIAISGDDAPRLVRISELMAERHPQEPHHYLFLLGTRPEWQSRGIGSALMRPVLEGCDRDGVPADLEATSERNRGLYERHGPW